MKQFSKIFSFELMNYMKNKVFVGVTLFLVIAIAVVMFFPRVSGLFKEEAPSVPDGESTNDAESLENLGDRPIMLIKSEEDAEGVSSLFATAFPEYCVKTYTEEISALKETILSGEAECAFVLCGYTSYTYYVNNLSIYDMNTAVADEVLRTAYQMSAMTELGMTPEEAAGVMSVAVSGSVESLGVDQMDNYWYTYIMIFALYMVILLYGQMVATGVATEKSSRAMELLITSVKPVAMMFGKVMAACLAGLIQLVAIFGSAILFYSLNRSYWGENPIIASIFDMPPALFGYMILFFILGFLIYAFMFGAVGSTASKLEDINTSVMPITLMFVAGFMVVMFSFASGEVDNLLMKVCSFVPFTSSMAMFTRIAMSTVPWYEIAASVAILSASVVGIGVISAKIYRMGVLLYGTPPKLGAILKSIWKA
ncbi:MAG: ABC transporter permease [Ruminococcaceae bacterium]|nr:ABC transporter permease [Oscillospiraceae bacterium]